MRYQSNGYSSIACLAFQPHLISGFQPQSTTFNHLLPGFFEAVRLYRTRLTYLAQCQSYYRNFGKKLIYVFLNSEIHFALKTYCYK